MTFLEQKITKVTAKEVFDSRDEPTIEVEVFSGEVSAKASVPSGKSTGSGEAIMKRDENGGVLPAIKSVEQIIGPMILKQYVDSEKIDRIILRLDMTRNKHELGGNAMLGVSMATMRLEAQLLGIPLWKLISKRTGYHPGKPLLYMNTLNGGAHANFCMPFQEYILVIDGENLAARYEKAKDIFSKVKSSLDAVQSDYYYGDEGGFATTFGAVEDPFSFLKECVGDDKDIFFAIDAAASALFCDRRYEVLGKYLTREELFEIYKNLVEKFDLRSIEDPFDEQDLEGFEKMMRWFQGSILVVGDDLTTTNPVTIDKRASSHLANAVIIKPNQIGTMFETFDAIREARKFDWKIIVSHRSGETMDSFIADLAVGVGAYGIKAGAPTQLVRAAKYDRLVAIEKEMEASSKT